MNCPICNSPSQLSEVHSGRGPIFNIRCDRCSEYSMYGGAKRDFERALQMKNNEIIITCPRRTRKSNALTYTLR
jgi:hypothetical protein